MILDFNAQMVRHAYCPVWLVCSYLTSLSSAAAGFSDRRMRRTDETDPGSKSGKNKTEPFLRSWMGLQQNEAIYFTFFGSQNKHLGPYIFAFLIVIVYWIIVIIPDAFHL